MYESTLTIPQRLTLFDILDVIYATSYHQIDSMGTLSSQIDIPNFAAQAKTEILSYLGDLGADSEEEFTLIETELKTLLTAYADIGLKTGTINNGSLGDLSGANFSFDDKRKEISKRVRRRVPFFQWHLILEKRMQDSAAQNYIPLMR